MKMIKLKKKSEEAKSEKPIAACCDQLPTIYLHGDVLNQLGVDVRKLSPGDVMNMQARVVVSGVSEYRTDEEVRPSLDLQFSQIGLSKARSNADEEFGDGFDDDE